MRRRLSGLLVGLSMMAGSADAAEPYPAAVTAQELGQSCAASIGRLHVELQAAAIREAKLQAEIARLNDAATAAQPKQPDPR